ncbi:uncharacterized transporter BU466-like [Hydractinia symbiolongicarpus]|uniref:uncharacterized transporter BU466-like n=1 Tax=Hydractinia symbiolongicarpus TaxID=13093 RepID=UPI00254B4BF8|nr:uncharacterized transporter BU466-like [Hydractinia symbiolongicarpus]
MPTKTTKINDEELKNWRIKRHRTFIAFTLQNACAGMEYSLTFMTLWLYLEETLKASHLKLFYGLVSAAYSAAQISSSIIVGHIFDKYRNVSMVFLIGNSLIVTGNIIYAIPYSPWNLLVGRLISGVGGCHRPIMTSELTRSYPPDELSSKFSTMGMAFALGFILGPGINFVFLKADFFIGPLHVTYTNAPACSLAIIFLLSQMLAIYLVSDLSKEFDLKEHETEIAQCAAGTVADEENERLLSKDHMVKDINSLRVLVQLLKQTDTLIILLFSFLIMYCMISFDLWQPLAIVKLMRWGMFELNSILFGHGIAAVAVLLLITYRPFSDRSIVYVSWICCLFVMLILIMYAVLAVYNLNQILNIVSWTFYALLFAVVVIFDEVFLIGAMARMTSSRAQAFTESIRLAFSRSGAIIALLTAAMSFTQLEYVCVCLAILTYLGFLVLVWRRKSLQNPVIIIS